MQKEDNNEDQGSIYFGVLFVGGTFGS